jgi:hypothetical protein
MKDEGGQQTDEGGSNFHDEFPVHWLLTEVRRKVSKLLLMATPFASLGRQLVNPMFAAQAYLFVGSIVVVPRAVCATRRRTASAPPSSIFIGTVGE